MFEFEVVPGSAVTDILSADPQRTIALVADTYRQHEQGMTTNPASLFLRPANPPASRVIALPAHIGGAHPRMGLKWVSSFPDNVRAGVPRASAVLILNDPGTGLPVACLEAAGISAARTAATAAIAATTLSTSRPSAIGFVGAGVIARTIADYLRHAGVVCAEARCHDLDAASAASLAAHLRESWDTPTVRGATLAEALDCELVVFATTAAAPYVPVDLPLRAGQLVLHVSLRDLDPAHLLAANNVVDDVGHCLTARTSPHLTELATGSRDFVTGTLGAALLGVIGLDHSLPTVFSPFGLGVLDVAVGDLVLAEARRLGRTVPIDGFFGSTRRW